MKKHLLIELLALVFVATAALSLAAVLPGRSAEPQGENSKSSLRTQAQRAGSVSVFSQPRNLKRYDDLKPLVKASAAIVVGTVQSKVTRMDEAETSIFTDYQVDVTEVLNGNVPLAPTIEVREPGGRVDFGNGTFAEVSMPKFWNSPEVGQSYVFFLRVSKEQKFRINGGPQGLFKLSDEKVIPQGQKEDKLMRTYNGESRTAFVAEIRDALK